MFVDLGVPELVVLAVVTLLVIWPMTRICAKAGYSPWLGVAIVIPIANLILLWFLAVADWPARRGPSVRG